jgi:hypothetical protein
MADIQDSIAGEAHGIVHGERAATYGHPRFDFTAIATVWTGLLQDLLKPGAQLDPYRISILMTGLKLCRLVKSPQHHDSRVDTIGYMLTMERLDEPEEEPIRRAEHSMQEDLEQDEMWQKAAELQIAQDREAAELQIAQDREARVPKYTEVVITLEPGEFQYINGIEHTNHTDSTIVRNIPFLSGTRIDIGRVYKMPPPIDVDKMPSIRVDSRDLGRDALWRKDGSSSDFPDIC